MGNHPSKKGADARIKVPCAQCYLERGVRRPAGSAPVTCAACGQRTPVFRRAASMHFTKIRRALTVQRPASISNLQKKGRFRRRSARNSPTGSQCPSARPSVDTLGLPCATSASFQGASLIVVPTASALAARRLNKQLGRTGSCPTLKHMPSARSVLRLRECTMPVPPSPSSFRSDGSLLSSSTTIVAGSKSPTLTLDFAAAGYPVSEYAPSSPSLSAVADTCPPPSPKPQSNRAAGAGRPQRRPDTPTAANNAKAVAYAAQYELQQQMASGTVSPAPTNPRRISEQTLAAVQSARSPRTSVSSANTVVGSSANSGNGSKRGSRSSAFSFLSRRSTTSSSSGNNATNNSNNKRNSDSSTRSATLRLPLLDEPPKNLDNDLCQLEQDRLNAAHYLYQMELQGNHFTRFDDTPMENVLDIGCGAGAWCLEMAAEHPHTNFVGVDLLPLYPTDIRPRNCRFLQANVLHGLPFADESFDFVHMRDLGVGIPAEMWPRLLHELRRVTKPGGRIELCESDLVPRGVGPAGRQLAKWTHTALHSHGIDPTVVRGLPRLLKLAGFQEVRMHLRDFRDGSHGGEMGRASAAVQRESFHALSPLVARTLGMDELVYEQTLNGYTQELEMMRAHHHVFYMVARRPGRTA